MATHPLTRYSLILRLRDRENAVAWREFGEIYEPVIYRVAVRRGLQHADAQELVQRVMVSVARGVDRFEPNPERGRFRTWLYTITQREFLKEVQAIRRHRALGGTEVQSLLADVAAASDSAEFSLEHRRSVFRWASLRVKAQVKLDTWRAFWLTAVEQQSIEATALELEMSVGAVYVARSRVMARLQAEVATYEDSES